VVMKEENSAKLLRIVSQSDMIQFLQPNINIFADWKNTEVGSLRSAAGPAVTVSTDASTLFAFIQMENQGVSSVAVVEHQGILVGSVSVSDLRSLDPTQLESLHLPVMEYLKKRDTSAPKVPLTCVARSTIEEAINLLAEARVHRLWVVDERWKKPIGLVSLTDIMQSLYEQVKEGERTSQL